MSTSSEQGAQTILPHRQVPQGLQHLKQQRNRYRVQHNRRQRTHHLDQINGSDWNELTRGAQRALETLSETVIGGEPSRGMLGTRGDSRGYPPWVHLFSPWTRGV